MVIWNEYLRGIFQKIVESHSILLEINDNPGDLPIIKIELLKIIGFFNVSVKKLETENYLSKNLSDIKSQIKEYLDTYYFEKEIDTINSLYSQDSHRIKNIRLKILESFDDKKLIDKIQNAIEDL